MPSPLPHGPLLSGPLGLSGALGRGFLKGPTLHGTRRGHQLSGKERMGQKRVTQRSQQEGERETGRSRCRELWEWGWGSKMGPAGWSERDWAETRRKRRRAEERQGGRQRAGPQRHPG